jgi:nucleosome binding factor SPN SPT16 subunit
MAYLATSGNSPCARAPCRQLAFPGNTGKSTVVLMPTMNCLVQLVEAPYTVVTLDDIEIVSLERVGFNTSTFDLVAVFKDFSRDPFAIGSVPAKQLDDIRKWLNVQNIKFFESKIPLNWKKILKQIADDPDGFMQVVRPCSFPAPQHLLPPACCNAHAPAAGRLYS